VARVAFLLEDGPPEEEGGHGLHVGPKERERGGGVLVLFCVLGRLVWVCWCAGVWFEEGRTEGCGLLMIL
jgi:hypothetical protein